MPQPTTTRARSSTHGDPPSCSVVTAMPSPSIAKPVIGRYFAPGPFDHRPAKNATTPDVSEVGAVSSPASNADSFGTVCTNSTSGTNSPVTEKPMITLATLPSEKFRLPKIRNGSSGSGLRPDACHSTNTTSSTAPATMTSAIVIGPATRPQP